jgi:hypothetical protein
LFLTPSRRYGLTTTIELVSAGLSHSAIEERPADVIGRLRAYF